MEAIINWAELSKLGRPPMPPPKGDKPGENMWDKTAPFYDQMAKMELLGTLNQLDCIPITKEDTVIDFGCGPGRITCQLAKRAKKVISVDSSTGMMAKCCENIAANGFTNVEMIFCDWNDAVAGENVPVADIIIASRSVGMSDIKKLSSFANKYAALICWANAPNLPECRGKLFENAIKEEAGGPHGHRRPPMMHTDRRLSYNVQYNIVYDMGYEPNINVIKDGFGKNFSTKADAYDELLKLSRGAVVDLDIFRSNVDKFLLPAENGGFDFWIETRSYVLWWEIHPKQF